MKVFVILVSVLLTTLSYGQQQKTEKKRLQVIKIEQKTDQQRIEELKKHIAQIDAKLAVIEKAPFSENETEKKKSIDALKKLKQASELEIEKIKEKNR